MRHTPDPAPRPPPPGRPSVPPRPWGPAPAKNWVDDAQVGCAAAAVLGFALCFIVPLLLIVLPRSFRTPAELLAVGFCLVVGGLAAFGSSRGRRDRDRARRGLCVRCGYDLRAT